MIKNLTLRAPNGKRITGEVVTLRATAYSPSFQKLSDGSLAPEYGGETEIDWDSTRHVLAGDGTPLFVDEDGNEWPLSACREEAENPVVECGPPLSPEQIVLATIAARMRQARMKMNDPHGDGSGRDAVPPEGDDWNRLYRDIAQALATIDISVWD